MEKRFGKLIFNSLKEMTNYIIKNKLELNKKFIHDTKNYLLYKKEIENPKIINYWLKIDNNKIVEMYRFNSFNLEIVDIIKNK